MHFYGDGPSDDLRRCYVVLTLFCGLLVLALSLLDALAPAGRPVAKIAGVDPPCYFGIAHSLLFDRDFDLTNEFEHVPPQDRLWTPVQKATMRPGSPYAIGYSLIAMPLLLGGTAMDALTGHAANGYGRFAIFGYSMTNVLLVGFGMVAMFTFLVRACSSYWSTEKRVATVALFVTFAIFFGTNVGFYAYSPMAHAATFFWATLFLAWWWRIKSDTSVPRWLLLGLMGGMLSISRWQEIWFLGAPLLLEMLEKRFRLTQGAWLRSRAAYAVVALACWIPQLLEWKSIYGRYLTVPPQASYDFRFPPVRVLQVLFSSCSGWFFWTPVTLLGVCGLVYGAAKRRRFYWPLLAVIALELCVIGSMRTFWSGIDSFSARYLTSCVPLAAFGLATVLLSAPAFWRNAAVACTVCFVVFTCLFMVQFRLDLVPRNERLTVAEAFGDKLHLLRVKSRKAAVMSAERDIKNSNFPSAVQTLEAAKAAYGEDRDVLGALVSAYRAAGRAAEAAGAEHRLQALLNSRLM